MFDWSKDPSILLCLWVRGGVNPGKVTSSNRKQPFTLTFTTSVNLVTKLPIPQMQGLCLWKEGGIAGEIPFTYRENMKTTYRNSQGKCEHSEKFLLFNTHQYAALNHKASAIMEVTEPSYCGSDHILIFKYTFIISKLQLCEITDRTVGISPSITHQTKMCAWPSGRTASFVDFMFMSISI